MTRTMYDSVTPEAIPLAWNPELVAGYIDGHYRSFNGLVARFPKAIHVPIAVFASTNGGLVLDCEAGDATPAQAPGWVKMRRAAGVVRPTVYTPGSQVGAVKQACAAAGLVQHRDYELWVAHYDGRPSPDGYGEAAKQFTDHGPGGENVDISAVFDDAWPFYAPPPQEDDNDMPALAIGTINPGEVTSIAVPPPHSGGADWGAVWFSLAVDFNPQLVRIAFGNPDAWQHIEDNVPVPVGRRAGWQLGPGAEVVSVIHRGSQDGDPSHALPISYLVEATKGP